MRYSGYRQTGQPSRIAGKTHVWAFKPGYNPLESEPAPYDGKWLIYASTSTIDALWKPIQQATQQGQLGDCSKVSCLGIAQWSHTKEHLICVYTSDYRNKEDVYRVRDVLRSLGIAQKIAYKSSEAYRQLDAETHPKSHYIKYRD